MYCHRCGALNDDQAAFCNKCGTALQNTLRAANSVTPTRPEAGVPPAAFAPPIGLVAVAVPVQYAGFWKRFLAALIDLLLVAVAWFVTAFICGFLYGVVVGEEPDDPAVNALSLVAWGATAILGWLYYALMESSAKQATLGKMALGIVVTDGQGRRMLFGRATGRYFGRILSSIILYIGFIIIAFTERKQGLHDMIADCLVVVKRRDNPPL